MVLQAAEAQFDAHLPAAAYCESKVCETCTRGHFLFLPPFVVTWFRAYHPPGVEESRTLLSEGVVGFRGCTVWDSFVFACSVTCTAPVCALHWYSNYMCITGVQNLGMQYSSMAPVCAVQ